MKRRFPQVDGRSLHGSEGRDDVVLEAAASMRVTLHAGLIAGQPAIWAASEPLLGGSPSTYGLDAKGLRQLVATLPLATPHAPPAVNDAVAWLPTRDGTVITAAKAEGAQKTKRRPAALEAKTVRVVTLARTSACAFFADCLDRETFGDDVRIGRDVTIVAHALRFAIALVAGKNVLPDLIAGDDGHPRACWKPVMGAADRATYHEMARALPPVTAALTANVTTRPSAFDARATLDAILAYFVDAAMRLARPGAARPFVARPSLHARWLAALDGPDAAFPATPDECVELAAAIAAWRRPVVEERAATYRLCLRVEEPLASIDAKTVPDAPEWNVAYLLQSRTDPTLLVDGTVAMRSVALRREYLTALGRAVPFSTEIDASLTRSGDAPTGFRLDTARALTFLQTDAARCAAADIGVILPSWWLGMDAKARVGLRAAVESAKFAGASALRPGALLEIDWTIALGNDSLTRRELERLARLKTPLVQLRGKWIHVDPTELSAALAHVERSRRRTMTVSEAMRVAVGAPVDGIPAGTVLVATGRVGDHVARLRGEKQYLPLEPPATLQATLRPYQNRGFAWLHFITRSGFGACLADDMGLGKTVQTLALIAHDWAEEPSAPVLLVCPTSVIGNWQREVARFTPTLAMHVHHGGERERGNAFDALAEKRAIVVTSYALLHRDRDLFARIAWRGVVLDEAQNVKNAESQQARAARSVASGYRIALTGTPVENHVGDLWSLMEFLNAGMLGTRAAFRRNFFVPIHVRGDAAATERLRAMTGPFILRRHKSDKNIISDLPVKQEYTVTCTLTREQATLYAAVLRDFEVTLVQRESIERRGKILATLSKLKQICNHPAQFAADNSSLPGRSGKLARLEDMLEEILDVGESALVFTQFAQMGTLIRKRLEARFGRDVAFLHGGVAKSARDRMVEHFQGRAGPAVFVLSLKAGGSGLNLTRANHVFHYDRWWNPAVENQATDRAFRIGQTKSVQVHKFVCAGTLEEKIAAIIDRKAAVSERVVGTGEGWLTELSSTQLRELVALAPEAVAE